MRGVLGLEEVKKVEEKVGKAGIRFGVEAWTNSPIRFPTCLFTMHKRD